MYVTSYKTNNSYTTYVIHDYGEDRRKYYKYQKPVKNLEWKNGARVYHSFHGNGVVISISSNKIVVNFNSSNVVRKCKSVQVTFEFKKSPKEVDSLKLCY